MKEKPIGEFKEEDIEIIEVYSDTKETFEDRINQYIKWCEKECYENMEGCDLCKTIEG